MFSKNNVAVDIGNKYIKIAYGRKTQKTIEVLEYDIISTPEDAFKDGRIFDIELIAKHISECLKKNRIRAGNIVFCVSGTGVIIRDIQLPKGTEEELEKMLEFEAHQYFPVNLEQYNMDFRISEEFTAGDSVLNRLLVVAAPQKQIEDYMRVMAKLKLEIEAIDIPSNCVLKFLFGNEGRESSFNDFPDGFTVIDFGHDSTIISIFNNKTLKFVRVLFNGSSEIDRLLANSFNLDLAQSEEKKKNLAKITDSEELQYVESILQNTYNSNFNEILRFFDFYYSRAGAQRLEKIFIIGGGSLLNALSSQMSEFFGVPVEPICSPENSAGPKTCSFIERVNYRGKKSRDQLARDAVYLVNAFGALVR